MSTSCYHCGLDIERSKEIIFDDKSFCCNGCKTVYEIFNQSGLTDYYKYERSPGTTPAGADGRYDFLDNEDIIQRLLDFEEKDTSVLPLYIPTIHCSSCIYVLENLDKLHSAISSSQVNFNEKKVRIVFNRSKISLKEIELLLNSIGYEPYISLDNYDKKSKKANR